MVITKVQQHFLRGATACISQQLFIYMLKCRGGARDFEKGGRSMSATMVDRRRKF